MGNQPPSAPESGSVSGSASNGYKNYKWPASIFLEARDMVASSMLVYSFGYILETARRSPDEFKGLTMESNHPGQVVHSSVSDTRLKRSFTPDEVLQLANDNLELLQANFPKEFKDPTLFFASVKILDDRAKATAIRRPLTIEEYDDKHQAYEPVYAVGVDHINKRITLAFRGTENSLAFSTNWGANLNATKKVVELDAYFSNLVPFKQVYMHRGFYRYLLEKTFDDTDDASVRKFDEVVADLVRLQKQFRGYKLYLTGHSLGGALAQMTAFFLATDDRFSKPVSCFTAASPRIGDSTFAEAAQALEQTGMLRCCRIVNDKDLIPLIPMFGFQHAGFQIRLSRSSSIPPEITYPKLVDTTWNRFGRTWKNSLLTNFDLIYDHGDYRERIELHEESLKELDLNELYADPSLTGWS